MASQSTPPLLETRAAHCDRGRPIGPVWAAILSIALALYGSGCASPTIDLTTHLQFADARSVEYDDRAWTTVLRQNVKDGPTQTLVDYDHLAAHRKPFDDYLKMIAATGPTLAPEAFLTRQSRLCYYINAYNAGVLAAVLRAGVPETMHDLAPGSLDHHHRVWIDGRYQTLAELRDSAIDLAHGDMRVVFALCDAAMGSPPLHGQSLRPLNLEETLRRLAQRAMDNHRIVAVDHEHQALMLSTMLTTQREAFLRYYKVQTGAVDATMLNVVLYFASNVRRQWLNTAVGYAERMIPLDRTLNRWQSSEP